MRKTKLVTVTAVQDGPSSIKGHVPGSIPNDCAGLHIESDQLVRLRALANRFGYVATRSHSAVAVHVRPRWHLC